MDWHKLADKYFSNDRLETGASKLTQTSIIGTAISDSENGYAKVLVDGNVTYPDDSEADGIYIPTGPSVKEGDQVHIALNGGVGKSPVIINATGWGDRLEHVANEASDVANAINQHFWTDTNGVHVTDVTQDEWEEAVDNDFSDISDQKPYHNALWNSLGMLFRSGLKNLVSITRSAISFFNGEGNTNDDVVAQFGSEGFQVGANNQAHIVGSGYSLQMTDEQGVTFLKVTDLRNEEHTATIEEDLEVLYHSSSLKRIQTTYILANPSSISLTKDSIDVEHFVIQNTPSIVFIPDQNVSVGDTVKIIYESRDSRFKSYTFGTRYKGDGDSEGAFSTSEGVLNVSSGLASHAEGQRNKATGDLSHSEGYQSIASGYASHAEGYSRATGEGAHSESSSIASGSLSHANGVSSATGYASTAMGFQVDASGRYQTVVGAYNRRDTDNEYAFIVGTGNGIEPAGNQINGFSVKWNGDIKAYGNVIDGYGNVLANASGGGTSNYNDLLNKPKIREKIYGSDPVAYSTVEISGTKSFDDLGMKNLTNSEINELIDISFGI